MYRIKYDYLQLTTVDNRLSVTRKKTLISGLNQFQSPIDTFDPHSDRMARHNLTTFNRF
ncbi:hypothetical protein VB620_01315 [Nodularia harveyana UHCC-0300]|uniref:Uncharacterized protein n=1 Tax=Nodularia harveyana UHCC-0300 TaxID=2974287 RepID=A0ABU5UC06_9CYAN|nr:hypothetical protein [Nodularia harveyana]MEA5579976.1 hypothetical protein [Nodularia harveyana UHCC-0300]